MRGLQHLAVFGVYPTYAAAEAGLDALRSSGFDSSDISVLFPEHLGATTHPKHIKPPAATGAQMGAWMGGVLGWLVGMGTLAIPGVGPFIAAGPIAAAMAGAGAGGAIGGIAGTLAGMGVPDSAAKRYEAQVKGGGILVSVHPRAEGQMERARTILERTGAQDIAAGEGANAQYAKALEPKKSRGASPVLRASKDAIGKAVDNLKGENIGTIEDLMIDVASGRVNYAILSFGGFLGMGDKLFAVPWANLDYDSAQGIFLMEADKEWLKHAPGFDKNQWPDMSDTKHGTEIYEYYHSRVNL